MKDTKHQTLTFRVQKRLRVFASVSRLAAEETDRKLAEALMRVSELKAQIIQLIQHQIHHKYVTAAMAKLVIRKQQDASKLVASGREHIGRLEFQKLHLMKEEAKEADKKLPLVHLKEAGQAFGPSDHDEKQPPSDGFLHTMTSSGTITRGGGYLLEHCHVGCSRNPQVFQLQPGGERLMNNQHTLCTLCSPGLDSLISYCSAAQVHDLNVRPHEFHRLQKAMEQRNARLQPNRQHTGQPSIYYSTQQVATPVPEYITGSPNKRQRSYQLDLINPAGNQGYTYPPQTPTLGPMYKEVLSRLCPSCQSLMSRLKGHTQEDFQRMQMESVSPSASQIGSYESASDFLCNITTNLHIKPQPIINVFIDGLRHELGEVAGKEFSPMSFAAGEDQQAMPRIDASLRISSLQYTGRYAGRSGCPSRYWIAAAATDLDHNDNAQAVKAAIAVEHAEMGNRPPLAVFTCTATITTYRTKNKKRFCLK